MDVVALGELLVDFTSAGISGQGNQIYEANPGGAPCNVLAMLQKLGRNTAFIGKVGKDSFGEMLVSVVKEQGISAEGICYDEKIPTTLAFVHNAADGERTFSFYRNPGADMMLRKEEVGEALLKETKLFHFGSLSMTSSEAEEATKYAIWTAKQNGAIISFDPNLRPALWNHLDEAKEKIAFGMSQCDVLKISDNEITFMTGETDIDRGVQKLIEKYQIPFCLCNDGKSGKQSIFFGSEIVEAEAFFDGGHNRYNWSGRYILRLPSGLHIKIWHTEARQRKGKGNATVCQCSSCIDHDEKRRSASDAGTRRN